MPRGLILAIDQGTSNTKAVLVDGHGLPQFKASRPLKIATPAAGFVEQDAWEIWLSVVEVAEECVRAAEAAGRRIEGIALSTQRETAVTWLAGREGAEALVGPAVSWQCRRSTELCKALAPSAERIRDLCGLPLDPLLTATKWSWVLNHNSDLRSNPDLRFGNIDAWLLWMLTGGAVHATEHSNASRTGLMNLSSLTWDAELLTLFELPGFALPEIRTSVGAFGTCVGIAGLANVPIVAMLGDSHAALAGHKRFTPGTVKATYGTGSSLMMLADGLPRSTQRLARTVAWSVREGVQYALEGNIAMSGAGVAWVGEFLGGARTAADVAALAEAVESAEGLVFVPAHVGLGAPYWDAEARGAIFNLERSHTSAHLARAAVEAIAFQVADVFEALQNETSIELVELRADGGATRNDALMQFQADLLDVPVLRSEQEELSAIGAAILGGLGLGWWGSLQELETLPCANERFEPSMPSASKERLQKLWSSAVQRVLTQEQRS